MGEWTRGAKVGLFAIVLLGATIGLYGFIGKSHFGPSGIALHMTMKDATGFAPLSRVNMAGIAIGRIKRIRVTPDGKARIDVEIDPGIVLHKDASVGKQSATLLSEPYLGMTPGSENAPVMVNDDEIVNVIEPVTTDDILQRVGDIATNVQAVTKSLRETVGNDEGERQMKAILRNVEQATFALSMIAQENRASLRKTLKNVEDITDNAKPKTAKILDNADEATARLNAIIGENRTDIRSAVKSTRETMDKASRATTTLDSALGHVDSIAGRIDRGEGTVGRLTKDEALIDEVQGAAEGLNDFVGGISRLQTIVGLHSEYYFLSNSIKNYLELRLQPREDKYYLIELVSDPRGRTTITQTDVDTTNPTQPAHYREVRTETVNSLRFSLQFARRLGPFTGRFGLKESTGGIALITHLFDDRFELQQDLFGFGEQLIPRWRVAFTYEFIKRLWLKGGVDNLLTRERRDYYVGLNLRFTDDDLKSFLFFAPKGANLAGRARMRDEPPAGEPWDLPLDAAPLAFVDLEMTGLDPVRDRICEVCVIRARGREVMSTVETLVRPDVPMGPGLAIHGIGEATLASAPLFADVAGRVAAALDGAILVAHAAEHDVAFLTAELARAGMALPIAGVLDTLPLARRCFARTSHRLGALCETLGIPLENAHRAGDDARATMALFFRVAAVLEPAAARDLWHVRIGERHARPEIVAHAVAAVEARVPVLVRYRPSKRPPIELTMMLTDVATDSDPPRIHGYDVEGRGRRELRADRVLAIDPVGRVTEG